MIKRICVLVTALFFASMAHAADQKPLVLKNGQVQQIGSSDTLVDASGAAITGVGPVRTAAPDGKSLFLTVTTTGSNCFTASGGAFTARDVGKYLTLRGAGSAANEWNFTSTITTVSSGSSICTAATPPRVLTAFSVLAFYGTDQTANIQSAFNLGQSTARGSHVTAGIYLVASPLTCMPPALPWNNGTAAPPLCNFDQGAHLIFVGSNPASGAFVTFGSTASDYSGYLREAVITGGTIDCNHICGYAETFPFFKHLKRSFQKTKNALWAGVRYNDSANAPASSGGIVDIGNDYEWDTPSLSIDSITSATQPVLHTTQPHGLTAARFVSVIGANNIPNGVPLTFWATVDDATHLRLHNVNGSGWSAFSGTALLNLALPAYRPLTAFFNATAATPPVIGTDGTNSTSGTGGFIQNGDQIDVWGVTSTGGAYDGTYTACALSGSGGDGNYQISLYAAGGCTTPINGTAITVSGGGYLAKSYALVSGHPVNAGVWLDQATDAEFQNNTITGTVIALYAPSGYDEKHVGNHYWNYPQHGALFYSHILGGDNSLIGEQVDCPAWFGPRFTAARNTIVGSEMNCSGFNSLPDLRTTYIRLDSGASLYAWGNRVKGQTSPLARPLYEISDASVAGTPYAQGGHPNYQRFGNQMSNTSYPVSSDSYRWSFSAATVSAQAQNTTSYLGVNGAQSTSAATSYSAPNYGAALSFTVSVDAAPAAGQTFTFTAFDGATSLGACTISNPSTSCTGTLSGFVSPGDLLFVRSVFSATSGSANVRVVVNFAG